MAFRKWLCTASSNAAADNTINWAEGIGDGSTTFNIPDLRGRASLASTTWEGLQLRGSAAIGMEGFLAILAVLRIGH
jgi:microcystin-dependent protein